MNRAIIVFVLCAIIPLVAYARGHSKGTACSGNNFNQVTLQPGCSTNCYEEPCEVYFRMPRGKGKYRIFDNEIALGDYFAGRKVSLGNFWRGTHIISVPKAKVPETLLHIGGSDNY